jgi:RNA polymerase sigma-70 factor, ECF subfamily
MEDALSCEGIGPVTTSGSSELDDIDELMNVYRGRVFRYVMLSLRDRDLAESITQDCFLKAFRARSHYRAECSISTWLIKIATNLIRDHMRKRGLQFWRSANVFSLDVAGVADRLAAREVSAETRLLLRDKLRRVWKVVDSLSQRQRAVFLLRFVEEMDISEISEATGLNPNTVKSHLHRALAAVRAGTNEVDA